MKQRPSVPRKVTVQFEKGDIKVFRSFLDESCSGADLIGDEERSSCREEEGLPEDPDLCDVMVSVPTQKSDVSETSCGLPLYQLRGGQAPVPASPEKVADNNESEERPQALQQHDKFTDHDSGILPRLEPPVDSTSYSGMLLYQLKRMDGLSA